ncbi:tetratricopeptide repeat protein [Streptomyces sp. SID8374]|uniref:tetratricopeptide repeat protein n=1 Tax=Streptomyces sp. SID8374 TaxID=2690354 RepID=UPI0031BAFBE3
MSLLAPHVLALLQHATDASVVAAALDVAVRIVCALYRTGDYLSARKLPSAAAATSGPKLGPEHRLVLSAHSRAGRALFRLGRFEESEPVLRRVLTDRERLLGPDHPDTLDSYFGINHPLQQLGRVAEGLMLFQHTTDGRERVLGKEHPLTLQSRAHLPESLPSPILLMRSMARRCHYQKSAPGTWDLTTLSLWGHGSAMPSPWSG